MTLVYPFSITTNNREITEPMYVSAGQGMTILLISVKHKSNDKIILVSIINEEQPH